MATLKTTGRGGITPVRLLQTQVAVVSNTASAETRNVSRGPAQLHTVTVDNQKLDSASGNTRVFVKLYDDISNSWVMGTTKAKIGFPIEQWASGATDLQGIGTYQVMHSKTGIFFEKGISVGAAKTAGDDATAAPGTDVLVELTHS